MSERRFRRREAALRRTGRGRAGHRVFMLVIAAAVAAVALWAATLPVGPEPDSGTQTAVAARAGDESHGDSAPAVPEGQASGARAVAQARVPSTGLPGRVASAAVETAPVLAPGSTARLDPDAAARLQAKLNQAQAELDALGASRADELPEADPAVLERLPPEIQELYRARLGR